MSKLKIGVITDDRPVTMTIKLPASVHRDLSAYAAVLNETQARPLIRTRLLLQCWRDLWRRTGRSDVREDKFRKTKDTA
jgi:muconolactone delta-isomerase